MSSSPVTARSTIARVGRVAIVAEFVIAIAVILYAGFHDIPDVFRGSPPAVPARIAVACVPIDRTAPCEASVFELNPGRYRVATTAPSSSLAVTINTEFPERARQLLVKVSRPIALRLEVRQVAAESAIEVAALTDQGRNVTVLPGSAEVALSFAADPAAAPGPIVLDELGVFENSTGLLSDVRPGFRGVPPLRYHGTLVQRAVAALCLFTVLAAVFLPPGLLKQVSPIVLAVVCLSLCVLDLAVLFSPYFAQDLRAFYAGGPLQEPPGANLNGGLYQGFRLLEGRGLTVRDGVVPWERMPGYGFFCAAAGALFGHRSLLELAISTVLLQVLFYSVAVGIFAWAAGSLFTPAAVWAVGLAIAWLPKEVGLTQVDAVIAPIAMLMLAALCVRLKRVSDRRPVPIAIDAAVHLTFALWFVMRPDVLPGWAAVSLYLHWRQWRRLLIPVVLFLVLGGTWGAYKARYTREFALTTTSAGASLFCGLWEVPSRFRFALACTDETYFGWIQRNTPYRPQTAAASSFATREVLKFWLTYPGHFVIMVYHKLMQTLNGDLWPGYPTQLQVFVFETLPRYRIVMPLVTIVALCAILGYQRERTLLLAWPLVFDAPLFWVMFASLGRFYSAVGIALLASAIPPLFERPFYASMLASRWRTAAVLAGAGVVAFTAWPFHAWLLGNDAFHYWTPLLDPAASLLSGYK